MAITVIFAGGLAIVVYSLKLSVYRIGSGSMEPAFPIGTLVIVGGGARPVPGEAVTFEAAGKIVTHVLVRYGKSGQLITRGLANPANDQWIPAVYAHNVRGSVKVKILLFAPSFWASKRGIATTIGVGFVVGSVLVLRLIRQQSAGRAYRMIR